MQRLFKRESLAQLMSCKLKLSLHPLSGVRPSVPPSFRPSVNIGRTNLDGKTYGVHIGSVDTLGEWLLPILELGHSDLLCGFYRAKFTFAMYFNGNKICLSYSDFWQQCPFQYAKWLSILWPFCHTNHLTLTHFSRSQQPFENWLCQISTKAQIF